MLKLWLAFLRLRHYPLAMPYFIANWKMNAPSLPAWVQHMAMAHLNAQDTVVVCPPFTHLSAAQMVLTNTTIDLGAQDCHALDSGAYTGDISADMIKRFGCGYVIVGHSERRQFHGETSEQVAQKAQAALAHGLRPIICIGETLAQHDAGEVLAVLDAQLGALPADIDPQEILIAYEPVWAIGSGRVPQADDIAKVHSHIKKHWRTPPPVLYGGSVKPENATEILSICDVDGVLVGGASLDAVAFGKILNAG